MNHNEAQQSDAVGRYILNEMSGDERERFEEHYFDCRDCGEDVLAGERLMANGRSLEREERKVVQFVPRPSWTRWIPLASAAMLVVIATAVMRPSRQPEAQPSMDLAAEALIMGETRAAGAPPLELRADAANNLLVVVMKPEWEFPRYEFQLRKTDGKVDLTTRLTAEQAKDQVNLLPRSLPAGSYVLAIHGVRTDGNRTEIATHEVRVR